MNTMNKRYTRIGRKLISEKFPDLEDVQIAFLESDCIKMKNRKEVYGDCTLVNKSRYDWCCPFDFIITLYEPNIADFSRKQIKILIEHELRHCGVDMTGTEPHYYLIPHDVEEFTEIIEQYGLYWDR